MTQICLKYCYLSGHCYNINESRFVVGTNQSSEVLIDIRKKQNKKIIENKQKWITAIKYVNSAGIVLLLLFYFQNIVYKFALDIL